MFSISEIDSIVDKSILTMNLKGEPDELYKPIEYLISIGGKRIRPKLAVICFNLFSDKIDRTIMNPALGLEVFHGFTLIHDDIMDNADIRRNKPTVHKKWNNNIAILSGDVMCIKAYQYIADAPPEVLKEVLTTFSLTAAQVCEGQQFDMNFELLPFITMEDYIGMIGLKTAVLIAASAKIGAVIAKAPAALSDSIYNYGYQLGLAFQIKDDYFDSFGKGEIFGKKIGGDILCGKKTWLLAEAYKRGGAERRKQLQELFKNHDIKPEDKISSVLAIYNELGIKEAAEEAMDIYHKKSLECLRECNLTATQIKRLQEFAEDLVNREK